VAIGDILTGGGYPIQMKNSRHVRTMLVFTYRKNNELCQAAAAAAKTTTGSGKRRKKRQVSFDSTQSALTQELLKEILNDQKLVIERARACVCHLSLAKYESIRVLLVFTLYDGLISISPLFPSFLRWNRTFTMCTLVGYSLRPHLCRTTVKLAQ